eukprot:1153609_1
MMENKTQRKRGKNKNQNEAFYHHTAMESGNSNSNHLYPVSTDTPSYSSPPRNSRNRYNTARNQMNYTQSHPHPNDNNTHPHINAPNQSNSHQNHNNHGHRPYNRGDNPPYHSSQRYYRANRNDSHPRYQSNATHNQSKYQYNAQKPRNSQYSHYQNHHVYPNHRNNNNPHSNNSHSHPHNNNPQNSTNTGNNHTQQRQRYANNSPRKHQDEYGAHPPHSNPPHSNQHINHTIAPSHHHSQHIPHNQHIPHSHTQHNHPHNKHHGPPHTHHPRSATPQHLNHTHTHNAHAPHSHSHNAHNHLHIMSNKHISHRLASQSASALMCNIDAIPHSPASVLSSPSATYYDVDDRIKDNDGSHKYHRFDDQNYPLNITQMTKMVQILGQKHEIHDKLKTRQHNRDFSTILARFLLSLLKRLETCDVDGFCVEAILLGGGAAAYVSDEHSKPKDSKTTDNNSDNNSGNTDEDGYSNECKYPPLHYNDVDIMLEIDFEDWDYLDEEDICSAYIDTRKRFLCGDEDNNGANSDCWTISSQNEATVHFLTDSFRIKITRPALKFISETIKQHDRQYKQQQFRKKQRNRSLSYPSLGVLKAKRVQLDKEKQHKQTRAKAKQREIEFNNRNELFNLTQNTRQESDESDKKDEGENTDDNEENPSTIYARNRPGFGMGPGGAHALRGWPVPPFHRPNLGRIQYPLPGPALNIPGGPPLPHPFGGYPLPTPKQPLRAVINWYDLAERLHGKRIGFNAYALCGDYKKAKDNLQKRNIGKVANPEKIHGGGFFKYCDLISKQWKRSEKLEKFLWIRLSWDIDINRDYDRKQSNNEYNETEINGANDRYNYMNDLKDIDRTLATYIRRHYKNRAHYVSKFLNCLEIVIKDLRQDDAALEVLCENIHKLRGKLERHLHEERLHDMRESTAKQNRNNLINTIRSKSPPITHTHHAHLSHNGRNVTTHTVHPQHPQPQPPPALPPHTLHPSLSGPPHPPNGTNPVFPPLPNGAPVMTPNGVLTMSQHFAHIMHHGKQIQSMRTMFTQPPPNVNAPPPPPPSHRQPLFYPAPNPVPPYLRANRPQQTHNPPANPPPPNNNTSNNNNTVNSNTSGTGSITLRPLHQNLQEYQQRYQNNEWVSLYTGHGSSASGGGAAAHPHPRKAYHIVPNGQMSKVLPGLVNINLTKAPPDQAANIGNIIGSYVHPPTRYVQVTGEKNDEDEERTNEDEDERTNDEESPQEEAVQDAPGESTSDGIQMEEVVYEEEEEEPDVVRDNDLILLDDIMKEEEKAQLQLEIAMPRVMDETPEQCHAVDEEHLPVTPSSDGTETDEENTNHRMEEDPRVLPATPSSRDSEQDPLNMDGIAVDRMMEANLEMRNQSNMNATPTPPNDAQHIIQILENIDIESDKNNEEENKGKMEIHNEANIIEDATEEGLTNTVNVLQSANNNNQSPPMAEAEGVKQTHFNAKPPLPNSLSPHQIKLVQNPQSMNAYPRFFSVNGQTYQFPVANYFVIVPQHNTPLNAQHQRRPVFIPKIGNAMPPGNMMMMMMNNNNNKDEDNKLEVSTAKPNDSASPPPPSAFNKGVFIENNTQNTQTSPSLLPIHNQLHFHSPNMSIHPRPPPPPPPPSHMIHRPYTHVPHQPPPFMVHSHLLTQQQQQQVAAAQQQQQIQTIGNESAAKENAFPPPQKNNSERFRRPDNMNDGVCTNGDVQTNSNTNPSNNNNNNAIHRATRTYTPHVPPNHSYFYNNNPNQLNSTAETHSNHNRNSYRQRNSNNNVNTSASSNPNNNSNNGNTNNSNYRNNNMHYAAYNKRTYNR